MYPDIPATQIYVHVNSWLQFTMLLKCLTLFVHFSPTFIMQFFLFYFFLSPSPKTFARRKNPRKTSFGTILFKEKCERVGSQNATEDENKYLRPLEIFLLCNITNQKKNVARKNDFLELQFKLNIRWIEMFLP